MPTQKQIPDMEKTFFANLTDSAGNVYLTVDTQQLMGDIHLVELRKLDKSHCHLDTFTKKKGIVLHFTAGFLKGDVAALNDRTRGGVTVPYLLARNGIIIKFFDSALDCYHIGKSPKVSGSKVSKETIGIEISNIGGLTLKNNVLLNYVGKEYCSVNDTDAYIKLNKPFNGYYYFASFTDEQYKSLASLIHALCSKYQIPNVFVTDKTEQLSDTFKGISTHFNYRPDKTDIVAFDWAKLSNYIAQLSMKASTTAPTIPEKEVVLSEVVITPSPVSTMEVITPEQCNQHSAEEGLKSSTNTPTQFVNNPEPIGTAPSKGIFGIISSVLSLFGKR